MTMPFSGLSLSVCMPACLFACLSQLKSVLHSAAQLVGGISRDMVIHPTSGIGCPWRAAWRLRSQVDLPVVQCRHHLVENRFVLQCMVIWLFPIAFVHIAIGLRKLCILKYYRLQCNVLWRASSTSDASVWQTAGEHFLQPWSGVIWSGANLMHLVTEGYINRHSHTIETVAE